MGAASVPVQLVERMRTELFETVVTGYGLTEACGCSTMSRPEDPPDIISRTVGRALPRLEIKVVDDYCRMMPDSGPVTLSVSQVTGGKIGAAKDVQVTDWYAPEPLVSPPGGAGGTRPPGHHLRDRIAPAVRVARQRYARSGRAPDAGDLRHGGSPGASG